MTIRTRGAALVVFACSLAVPSPASAAAIGLVFVDPADPLYDALLLALRLEFPEADVVPVSSDGSGAGDLAATVSVTRAEGGYLVRVEERGGGVAVERKIQQDLGGEAAAAQTIALLARSLLGVALLYEPERAAASPALAAIAKAPARRVSKALAPAPEKRPPPVSRRPAPILLAVTADVVGSLPPIALLRPGARVSLSYRFVSLPLEIGAEAAWLASATVEERGHYRVTYDGVPFGGWLRWRVQSGRIEIAPGIGGSIERSIVDAEIQEGGQEPRTAAFRDWNPAIGLEVRLRYAIAGALFGDAGMRLESRTKRQDYAYAGERILSVPGLGWGFDVGLAFAGP